MATVELAREERFYGVNPLTILDDVFDASANYACDGSDELEKFAAKLAGPEKRAEVAEVHSCFELQPLTVHDLFRLLPLVCSALIASTSMCRSTLPKTCASWQTICSTTSCAFQQTLTRQAALRAAASC